MVNPNTTAALGSGIPQKVGATVYRVRTVVDHFSVDIHQSGIKSSASCIYGAAAQATNYILYECNILYFPNSARGQTILDNGFWTGRHPMMRLI